MTDDTKPGRNGIDMIGEPVEPIPDTGDEEPGEPFRVTYCTDEGEDATHLRILDVEGDSMEPEIREGDWVVVDLASRLPEAGGAFLLRLGERLVTRRVEAAHGDGAEDERPRLRLIPADHSPCRAEDVHVRNKVLWVVRRVVRTGRSAGVPDDAP